MPTYTAASQKPIVLADNVFDAVVCHPGVVLTASSTAAGRSVQSVADGRRDTTWWQAADDGASSSYVHTLDADVGAGATAPASLLFLDRGHTLWGLSVAYVTGDGAGSFTTRTTRTVPAFTGTTIPVGGDPYTGWCVTEEGAAYAIVPATIARVHRLRISGGAGIVPVVTGLHVGLGVQLAQYLEQVADDDRGRTQSTATSATGWRASDTTYSWRKTTLSLAAIMAPDYDDSLRPLRALVFDRGQPAVVALDAGRYPERAGLFVYDGTSYGAPISRVTRKSDWPLVEHLAALTPAVILRPTGGLPADGITLSAPTVTLDAALAADALTLSASSVTLDPAIGGGGGSISAPTAMRLDSAALPDLLDGGFHLPDYAAYEAKGVPALSAGASYTDPATGVRVFKLATDAFSDYPNGGPRISQPLDSSGTRAYLTTVRSSHAFRLVFARPTGTTLTFPQTAYTLASGYQPADEICFAFSNDPATPQIAYILRWLNDAGEARLIRYDVVANAEAPNSAYPSGGRVFAWSTSNGVAWLTLSADDSVVAFQRHDGSLVQFYVPATNTATTYTTEAGFNEGKLTPDGRFFAMSYDDNSLHYLRRSTGVVTSAALESALGPHAGHSAPADDGLWPTEADEQTGYWTQGTNTVTATAKSYADPGFTRDDYNATGWRQPTVSLGQRYYLTATDDPQQEFFTVGTWTAQGGGVYRAPVTAYGAYASNAARKAVGYVSANGGVITGAASGRDRWIATLIPATSSSVAAGECFVDHTGNYMWAHLSDGSDPTGKVSFTWAHGGGLHLGFTRMNGADKRLLLHTANRMPYGGGDTDDVYYYRPRASQSADGAAVVFSSTMARYGGQTDVFVVYPPRVSA